MRLDPRTLGVRAWSATNYTTRHFIIENQRNLHINRDLRLIYKFRYSSVMKCLVAQWIALQVRTPKVPGSSLTQVNWFSSVCLNSFCCPIVGNTAVRGQNDSLAGLQTGRSDQYTPVKCLFGRWTGWSFRPHPSGRNDQLAVLKSDPTIVDTTGTC